MNLPIEMTLSARVALGTVQFGLPYGVANPSGQVSPTEAKDMLRYASASGVDTLDTAISYGDSETRLGQLGVDDFRIVTKIPPLPADCVDVGAWVKRQARLSLRRLNVRSLYGLLLHRPDDLLGSQGATVYRSLCELREQGLVRKIGISVYSLADLSTIVARFRIDLIQAPFNLVDRRLHATGWLRRLKSDGIEVHVRSVFLQGLLLMPQRELPPQFAKWNGLFGKWYAWLAASEVSPIHACLAFALAFEGIDRVIVGADNLRQLEEIISASLRLPSNAMFPDIQSSDQGLINPSCWSST